MAWLRAFLLSCLLAADGAAWADASLLGKEEALAALKDRPPCCVIDGRSAKSRRMSPLPDAVPYRKGLKIEPSATVVVLADDDRAALEIARTLAQSYPGKPIAAIRGGLPAWNTVLAEMGAPPAGLSFVIPRNTCEHDAPLQRLLQKKP